MAIDCSGLYGGVDVLRVQPATMSRLVSARVTQEEPRSASIYKIYIRFGQTESTDQNAQIFCQLPVFNCLCGRCPSGVSRSGGQGRHYSQITAVVDGLWTTAIDG